MRGLLSICILLLMGVSVHAQMRGNDTGGSIPWSADNEMEAHQIAAEYCARWEKYHRITSIHRRDGDFIKFSCLWKPDADRYAQPRLRTWRADLAEARDSDTSSTRPSASAQPGLAAADPITELSTQFRQMLATLSADWGGATNAIAELPAQFSRALGTLSAAVQPEMPEGEKKPPKPPGRALVDSSAKKTDPPVPVDAPSTYAQAQ
jgi:hypothetical protein